MAFDDDRLDTRPWTRGAIAMIIAGGAQLLTTVLQIVLTFGLGTAMRVNDPSADTGVLVILAVWLLLPNAGTVISAGVLFLGARSVRLRGAGPLVWAALALGIFWPVVRATLAMLACGVLESPLHLGASMASVAAMVVVAMDPGSRPLRD